MRDLLTENTPEQLTPNFTREEFACSCGCGLSDISPLLVAKLQGVRGVLGKPIQINSGCRCSVQNEEAGGSSFSSHLCGFAADLGCNNSTDRKLLLSLLLREFRRVGIGNNFIHVDIDFSNITIEFVNVNVSGNDCADLSGGTYSFSDVKLSMCGDKGISIGEKSTFIANKVEVNGAYIGVSSKDYSETVIRSAKLVDTEFCYEASKKKQEFGGAKLLFDSLSCKGNVLTDKHSTITVGARLQ